MVVFALAACSELMTQGRISTPECNHDHQEKSPSVGRSQWDNVVEHHLEYSVPTPGDCTTINALLPIEGAIELGVDIRSCREKSRSQLPSEQH